MKPRRDGEIPGQAVTPKADAHDPTFDRLVRELGAAPFYAKAGARPLAPQPRAFGAPPHHLVEIFDKLPTAVLVYRDGRLLYANRAYTELSGYASLEEAVDQPVGNNVHSGDTNLVRGYLRARIRGDGTPLQYEFRVLHPDGRVIWIQCLASPIIWDAAPAWLATYHDATDQRLVEEALKRSELLFTSVFQNIPDQLVLTTLEGRVIDVNEAFLRARGRRRAEVIGCTFMELHLWSDRIVSDELMDRLRRTGRVRDVHDCMRTRRGESIDLSSSAELLDINGEELILFVSRDITEYRRTEAKIAQIAHQDALTGLGNRLLFQNEMERALRAGRRFGVVGVDIDRFKEINDVYGASIGDAVLQQVAQRLRACVRGQDTVARLDGDEFAIIQLSAPNTASAPKLAERIVRGLSEPFEVEGHQLVVGASVGIAVAPRDGASSAALLRATDLAVQRAKRNARGGWREYGPAMEEEHAGIGRMELELRRAVIAGEFELFVQPVFDLHQRCLAGCEALLRWRHPVRGLVEPQAFVGLAEQCGLNLQIGTWLLHRACAEAATWPRDLKVAVNVSPVQLRRNGLLREVRAALDLSGLSPERLELGVTESVVLQDTEGALHTLRCLKAMGISLALDDFGTGYSSLGSLVQVPFDRVKIDRSFVAGLGQRADCTAIVRAVASLCSTLGLSASAEGIETPEQLAMLVAEGVTEGQGQLFGPAQPVMDVRTMLGDPTGLPWPPSPKLQPGAPCEPVAHSLK